MKEKEAAEQKTKTEHEAFLAAEFKKQMGWLDEVSSNCSAYKEAPNEIRKSAVFRKNETLIRGRREKGVRAELIRLSTTQGGGRLDLGVKVGESEFVTSLSPYIERGAKVSNQASDLALGQCVVVSMVVEGASSMLQQSQVCDPEYFVSFNDIRGCE